MGRLGTPDVRRLWPEVLGAVKSRRRFAWILLSQNAQVLDAGANGLTLAFNSAGARDSFHSSGSEDVLRDCLVEVMGADLPVHSVVEGAAVVGQGRRETAPHQRPAATHSDDRTPSGHRAQQAPATADPAGTGGQQPDQAHQRPAHPVASGPAQQVPDPPAQSRPEARAPSRRNGTHPVGDEPRQERASHSPGEGSGRYSGWSEEPPPDPQEDGTAPGGVDPGDLPSMDDASVDETGQSATQLLMDQLDAEIISEEDLS